MAEFRPDFQQVSGLWTLPVVETIDQAVSMRTTISVESEETLASEDVDATMVAGGVELAQTYGPAHRQLTYVSTGSTTAVAYFGWANPENRTPEQVYVRVRDETVTFLLGAPGDLPVA